MIFNLELLDRDGDIGDYVIVHELLHAIVPNHGKLWKSLMRAHLGDYEGAKDPADYQIRAGGHWRAPEATLP